MRAHGAEPQRPAVDARLEPERQAVAERVDLRRSPRRSRRASARCAAPGRRSLRARRRPDRSRTPPARAVAASADGWAPRRRASRRAAAARPRGRRAHAPRRRSAARRRSRSRAGSPTTSSSSAPRTISITASAMPSCTHSSRSAEQRWPAERNALATTASTTCSGSAVESTTIALMPPVSAISGTIGPSLAASARWIAFATAVDPVKQTPAVRGCGDQRGADAFAAAVRAARAHRAARPRRAAARPCAAATAGVCSAGFAATLLPATSAATTWPVKIASGKFHGLMQTKTPRPPLRSVLRSPVGPGSSMLGEPGQRLLRRSSGRSRPPRALRRPHRARS